jgi:hypothetical protein
MSPDIHWDVGEDAEQETITQTTDPRRSRRSWIAVLIVVILGAGLGVVYRAIPEPAPRPTLTPVPVVSPKPTRPAVPVALYQTVDREAQALADGDFETYLDTRTQVRSDWVEVQQRQNFMAWGRPKDDRPLYTLVDFNLLTATSAWADIRQFREGRYFRETRFYYHEGEGWLHGSLNHSLWSGQEESLQTPHFDVKYAVEDRDLISATMQQLESDYQALCRDLGCATLGQELTFTVKMKATEGPYTYPVFAGDSGIHLPSPRVMGFYESGRAYYWKNNSAHWVLAQAIAERVYGLVGYDQPGGGIVWAGSVWAVEHIDPLPAELWNNLGDLTQKPLLSPGELWEIAKLDEPGLALAQLYQLVRFIEQEYGAPAVTQLLGTIDSTKSLAEAIEAGLHVSFAEFDQKWQAWVKTNLTTH